MDYDKRLNQNQNLLKCDFTNGILELNEKYKKNFYGRIRFNLITITITTRFNHGRGQKGVIYLTQSRLFEVPLLLLLPTQSYKLSPRKKAHSYTAISLIFKFKPGPGSK